MRLIKECVIQIKYLRQNQIKMKIKSACAKNYGNYTVTFPAVLSKPAKQMRMVRRATARNGLIKKTKRPSGIAINTIQMPDCYLSGEQPLPVATSQAFTGL